MSPELKTNSQLPMEYHHWVSSRQLRFSLSINKLMTYQLPPPRICSSFRVSHVSTMVLWYYHSLLFRPKPLNSSLIPLVLIPHMQTQILLALV